MSMPDGVRFGRRCQRAPTSQPREAAVKFILFVVLVVVVVFLVWKYVLPSMRRR